MSNVVQSISVSVASSGDNTAIAAVAGQVIQVYALALTTAAAVDMTLKDGASTTLGVSQGITSLVLDPMEGQGYGTPRFTLTAGNAFVINLSSAVACKGTLWYTQN